MDRLTIDTQFWGIRLRAPYSHLTAEAWDWDKTHAAVCSLVQLVGVECAETLLGTVVPAVLRDRADARLEASVPENLAPEVRLSTSGSRWADVRIALEGQLPRIRESLARVAGALTAPTMLPRALADVHAHQGLEALGVPVLTPQGKLVRTMFLRPEDVYTTALAVAVENVLPLDSGALAQRASLAKMPGSFAAMSHWRAYRGQ